MFTEFTSATLQDWLTEATKAIKGQSLEILRTETYEGIVLEPFYNAENAPKANSILSNIVCPHTWKNRVEITISENESANTALIQEAIQKGAEEICLYFGTDKPAIYFNDFSNIPINRLEINDYQFAGGVIFDFLAEYTVSGLIPENAWQTLQSLLEKNQYPAHKSLTINLQHFHNAGGNAVQELAFGLNILVEYADKLTDLGLKPEHIFQNVSFSVAVGGNYFMEIAKMRALRLLWANILNAYQVAEMPCTIHARTATWNKSTLDVYNNLLRVTTETMSAGIGGADSLTVATYDEVLNNSAEDIMHEQAIFARRIARNLSILLKEEAHLDKVTDASHGTYYIEHLTAQLAQKAWALFQNMEAEGGFMKVFEQGLIQAEIEQIATLKRQRFAEKKEILVGVNRYENPKNEASNAKPTQKITPISTLRLLSLQRLAEEKESGQ